MSTKFYSQKLQCMSEFCCKNNFLKFRNFWTGLKCVDWHFQRTIKTSQRRDVLSILYYNTNPLPQLIRGEELSALFSAIAKLSVT